MKSDITLSSGLYDIRGKIGFLGYQTRCYAYFIELFNESGKKYCCKDGGLRHPATGLYVRKSTARKLNQNEITDQMMIQWRKRIKEACGLVWGSECKKIKS